MDRPTAPSCALSRYADGNAEQWLDADSLAELQQQKLSLMLREVTASNPFYRDVIPPDLLNTISRGVSVSLSQLPFTTRAQLEASQLAQLPYGTNLTYPLSRYTRFHQTSGSSGTPMRWLDTPESWEWFKRCWSMIFGAAGVGRDDRLMFPFSFGPFVGFWAAFESSVSLGRLSIPAGGLSTVSRLKLLVDNAVTAVCCTPTYALRMAEVAAETGVDLAGSAVRALIVAGEAGGSIPEVRSRIEKAWGARVFDHNGMTEIGALGFECHERPGEGVHLIESECIAEVIDPVTLQPAEEVGELVVTNLGRWGSPLIRYRTGDQVRLTRGLCACGRSFARLEGGILGRVDDMFTVRGNNVFPNAVEAVIRRFPEIAEFRVNVLGNNALAEVRIEIEPAQEISPDEARVEVLTQRLAHAIQGALSFRADVTAVAAGSLPRFEMKAKRFVRSAQTSADRSTRSGSTG